jgi:hypothetical protein
MRGDRGCGGTGCGDQGQTAHFWQWAQFWHCEHFWHGAWCWHGASADTEVVQGRAAAEAALAEAGGWIMRITMTMSAARPAMIEARRTTVVLRVRVAWVYMTPTFV